MKVILLKDIRAVGQHLDIKEVADGYASNFLLPKGLAEMATPEKMQALSAQKEAQEAERRREEETLNNKIVSLHNKSISLTVRATEKGGLFKTVTAGDIVKAILSEYSLEIPEHIVHISNPIKTVGEHTALLKNKNQKAEVTIRITAAS